MDTQISSKFHAYFLVGNSSFFAVKLSEKYKSQENGKEKTELRTYADLPTVPDFPGQYRKYKPCPGVPNFCSKIPDFDRPGYGVKYLCDTRKRDRPDRVNCV